MMMVAPGDDDDDDDIDDDDDDRGGDDDDDDDDDDAAVLTVLNQARLGSTISGSSTPCSSTNQILKLKLGPCDIIGTEKI